MYPPTSSVPTERVPDRSVTTPPGFPTQPSLPTLSQEPLEYQIGNAAFVQSDSVLPSGRANHHNLQITLQGPSGEKLVSISLDAIPIDRILTALGSLPGTELTEHQTKSGSFSAIPPEAVRQVLTDLQGESVVAPATNDLVAQYESRLAAATTVPARIRVMNISVPDKKTEVIESSAETFVCAPGKECGVKPQKSSKVVRWIDIQGGAAEAASLIADHFTVRPADLEDCLTYDERAKVTEFNDHLFVVTHVFAQNQDAKVDLVKREVHAFIGPNYLITVHADQIDSLDATWERVTQGRILRERPDRNAGMLYYHLSEAFMNENSPMIDALKEAIGKIQVQAQQGKLRNIQLAEEFPDITNALTNLDRLVTGQSRVFTTLAKRLLGEGVINERTAKRFEHLEQESRDLKEDLKMQRGLIDTSISTSRLYVSWIDTSIARKIAALQAVCLPIIATSGFWGQNFTSLPTSSSWFFWGTIGFNVLATSVLLSQAVKERWFSK